jgi:hypothetical protein
VKDESEIRGHRRTYIGSMPGRIIQAIKRAGSRNPVLLLDELDKLGADYRGDPASALLEVLDPAQNHAFMDHYLDAPFDLSQVMFIATANVEDNIPHALLDRLEIVPLPGYIEEEKTEIARHHLLPRVRAEHGLTEAQLTVTPEAIQQLIRRYTREAGVRQLERELAKLHRKAARRVVEGDSAHIEVTEARLAELIGPPPFHVEPAEHATTPGVAIGLAWTAVGGEILFIEAVRFPQGKGQLRLTGSLGDVMKESVEAAMSLLRSRSERFGIPPEVFTSFDYHVHVPSGGIPKDGPSAGVTMLTALASLMTGRKVRSELAMTGELTLRGKVLPVGGVKEKVLAARRAGIKVVVLPKHNEHDLADIPALLRDDLTFHFVTEADEVLALALEGVVVPLEVAGGGGACARGRGGAGHEPQVTRMEGGDVMNEIPNLPPGLRVVVQGDVEANQAWVDLWVRVLVAMREGMPEDAASFEEAFREPNVQGLLVRLLQDAGATRASGPERVGSWNYGLHVHYGDDEKAFVLLSDSVECPALQPPIGQGHNLLFNVTRQLLSRPRIPGLFGVVCIRRRQPGEPVETLLTAQNPQARDGVAVETVLWANLSTSATSPGLTVLVGLDLHGNAARLASLRLQNTGPAPSLTLADIAPRVNVITGDNGLGKSFLLEAVWWMLTGRWHMLPAVVTDQWQPAAISAQLREGAAKETRSSPWDRMMQGWGPPLKDASLRPGLVVYARVDGSFSVWDSHRNVYRTLS